MMNTNNATSTKLALKALHKLAKPLHDEGLNGTQIAIELAGGYNTRLYNAIVLMMNDVKFKKG